jgi:hypothetical protein
MAANARISCFQLSLRTLLLTCTLAGTALGWWFMPFVRETRREDGSLRTRFELRRDWRGQIVSHGKQSWHMRGGETICRTDYGTPYDGADFVAVLNQGDFDSLIWLITETIAPESWSGSTIGRVNLNILIDP